MLSHIFTTPVLKDSAVLDAATLEQVREYLLQIRKQSPGEAKSNRGGWHSTGNLFDPEQYKAFPAMQEAVTKAIFRYIADAFGYRGEIQLSLTGWTVINHAGHYNAPHNHAANMLSGALYISVPPDMKGGDIVFQDPRLNLNAHETRGMRKLGITPPWMNNHLNVAPVPGDILIFPSWLIHYVEPFQSEDPDAVRIVVSFNCTAA